MAQTQMDNNGPGGLFSNQTTSDEAAFYSRTLITCAELEKTELCIVAEFQDPPPLSQKRN